MSALLFTLLFQGLAFLALACLATMILNFTSPQNNLLRKFTLPILKVINFITPALFPKSLHIFFAVIWLLALRVAFYLTVATYGLLPAVAP